MSEREIVHTTDPEAAFSILSNRTRVAILRALWQAEDREATFSELQRAIGMRDSGKFNYHLGQFEGLFVEETGSGYRLRRAGVRLVGSLLAGAYSEAGEVDPVTVEAECPSCAGDLSFQYVDELVRIDCEACGNLSTFPVPPGVFADYEVAALPEVTEQYVWSEIEKTTRGFCRDCDGRLHSELVTAAETADEDETDLPVDLSAIPMVRDECERCGATVATNLGLRLVGHPAVVTFYHDHGIDYRELPVWQVTAATSDRATIHDREPRRASVTYVVDGDALTLTVDSSASVVDVEREE